MLFSDVLQKIAVQFRSLWTIGTLVLWRLTAFLFNVSRQGAVVHVHVSAHPASVTQTPDDKTCKKEITLMSANDKEVTKQNPK